MSQVEGKALISASRRGGADAPTGAPGWTARDIVATLRRRISRDRGSD